MNKFKLAERILKGNVEVPEDELVYNYVEKKCKWCGHNLIRTPWNRKVDTLICINPKCILWHSHGQGSIRK